ncbi:MAG: DUF4337 domain-containing protein [Acidobacteriaceae bacterium]|nr:DUF4337 domain-containing protein [Acidobacteriaceae bacterium]
MSANEELELKEHIEHAENRFDKMVAGGMAIIAALLAVVSVAGQHFNTEQLLRQGQASDEWAYYQAKNIRHYVADAAQDILTQEHAANTLVSRYQKDSVRYKNDENAISEKAKKLEEERDVSAEKAHKFHFGEVFLEIAIVLLSLSILTKFRPLALVGALSAIIGVVWASGGFLH